MATIQLHPDFKEFLKLLSSHQVEYLLIGGYAVSYYGYLRATADMDRSSFPSSRLGTCVGEAPLRREEAEFPGWCSEADGIDL